MAKLESKNQGNSKFFKFQKVGDVVVGKFLSFDQDVPGKFGPETNLILETEHGAVSVKCTADLEAKIKDNLDACEGMYLTIRYDSDKNVGKASPMKVYDVETSTEAPF
jgi:hypothetical protein